MTTPTDRPNVVVIYADDLGWGDLGCFGADDFDTPALDGLAASGVRLPQWYVNSPVCSPSRASLLTGRHPAHAGVEAILGGTRRTVGLPDQPTLASELRGRGYATGIFGKWHLGVDPEYGPLKRGFDEHFGFLMRLRRLLLPHLLLGRSQPPARPVGGRGRGLVQRRVPHHGDRSPRRRLHRAQRGEPLLLLRPVQRTALSDARPRGVRGPVRAPARPGGR